MSSPKPKKKSRKPKKAARRLVSRLSKLGLSEKAGIIHNPSGQVRMSEVLIEFIAPYAAEARTEEEHKRLLSVALVAWNAALFPANQRQEMVDSIIDKAIPSFAADDAKLIIHELIRRKDRYFSEITRAMLSYELTMTKDGPHVFVASTL
jgi:hypothetical protein